MADLIPAQRPGSEKGTGGGLRGQPSLGLLGSRAGTWQACGPGEACRQPPSLSFHTLLLLPWHSPLSLLQPLSVNVFPFMFLFLLFLTPLPSVPK